MVRFSENASVKNIAAVLDEVRKEFTEAEDNSGDILFDFGALRRLDMAVAQVVMASLQKARREGIKVGIRSACEDVRRQLNICGLKL